MTPQEWGAKVRTLSGKVNPFWHKVSSPDAKALIIPLKTFTFDHHVILLKMTISSPWGSKLCRLENTGQGHLKTSTRAGPLLCLHLCYLDRGAPWLVAPYVLDAVPNGKTAFSEMRPLQPPGRRRTETVREGQKKPSPPSPSLPSGHPQGGASSEDVEHLGCGVTKDVSMRLLCLGSLCPPWEPRTLGRRLTLSGVLAGAEPLLLETKLLPPASR